MNRWVGIVLIVLVVFVFLQGQVSERIATIYGLVIVTFVSTWLLVSLFVCAYWFFNSAERFWAEHERISWAIGLGGFLGCTVMVSLGIRYLLWFIPESWAYETDGEIHVIRDSVASVIGAVTAFSLLSLFERKQKGYRENKELRNELEIVEVTHKISILDRMKEFVCVRLFRMKR